MNQTFDLRRFGLLLRLHLSEHLRTYLMGMVVLLGALALLFLMMNTLHLDNYNAYIYAGHSQIFLIVFTASSCWFASEAFQSLRNPVRGIPYLMIPASQLEKFLVTFLLLLSFIPVFTIIFYLVEGFFFAIVNAKLPVNSKHYGLMSPYQPEIRTIYLPFFIALIAYTFFYLGALYFSKAPFVKTGVIAFLLFIASFYLHTQFLNWLLPSQVEVDGGFPFLEAGISPGKGTSGSYHKIQLPSAARQAVTLFWYFMFPALWAITYVRFREKQL